MVNAHRRRTAAAALCPILVALATALLVPARAGAQSLPDLDEVMAHLDELYRATSAHAIMEMSVVRPRASRDLTLESWSKGKEMALVVIRAPAREAGTATLRTADGLWSYGARADRLIRIPTGLLSESWMGSHLTNDDLIRETSYEEDYEGEVSWTTRDGTRYLQVTMTPKPGAPVVYTRLVFLLTAEDWTPLLWEYYDRDKLVRTISYEDVRVIAGRPLPMRMVVQPADLPDERTVITYRELELDIAVDDEIFTSRGLRRVAGE
ncbi:MAG TPA: outer membrane lipoprotein-sorting protein [Longimicrobiales bacterium]|nr:outer membrane lipoprotein-sorting protein [Longimicrobiales bacterium]